MEEIQGNKQEYLLKLGLIQQEARQCEEQIQMINQQVFELKDLQGNLAELDKGKEKEFLASIGKGIFLKSEIKDKDLFVNVGAGIVLRKSPKETAGIIEKQMLQLGEIKNNLVEELKKLYLELNKIIEEAGKDKI